MSYSLFRVGAQSPTLCPYIYTPNSVLRIPQWQLVYTKPWNPTPGSPHHYCKTILITHHEVVPRVPVPTHSCHQLWVLVSLAAPALTDEALVLPVTDVLPPLVLALQSPPEELPSIQGSSALNTVWPSPPLFFEYIPSCGFEDRWKWLASRGYLDI